MGFYTIKYFYDQFSYIVEFLEDKIVDLCVRNRVYYLNLKKYRVTILIVTKLPLTPKEMLRFSKLLILKLNFCFDVNWKFVTT